MPATFSIGMSRAQIFFSRQAVFEWGDLGQAKQLCNTSCASTLCGSPAYFSPEEALGTEQYTAKCDMWALGVILYELISENHTMPFVGRNLACLLVSIKTKTPRPLPTTTTKPFIHLCNALLEKEAALRPSASEVLLRPCLSEIIRTHGLADITSPHCRIMGARAPFASCRMRHKVPLMSVLRVQLERVGSRRLSPLMMDSCMSWSLRFTTST